MTMAVASFFAGEFPGVKGGVLPVFALCVAFSSLLPFVAKFVVPVFFKPDVVIAADPLKLYPKNLAEDLRAVFMFAAAHKRPVRLLVPRVPGHDIELRINAAKLFVEAEIRKHADGISKKAPPPRRYSVPMDKLVPRRSPAVFNIRGNGGSNALLTVNPDGTWNVPFPCEPNTGRGYGMPLFCVVVILINLNRAALL